MNLQPCVFIVENDDAVRDSLEMIIEAKGLPQQSFENIECFIKTYTPGAQGCLVLDASITDIDILGLSSDLLKRDISLPMVILTRYGNSHIDYRSINTDKYKVLNKPVQIDLLIETIHTLLNHEFCTTENLRNDR